MMLLSGAVSVLTWTTFVMATLVATDFWGVLSLVGPAVYVGVVGAAMLVTAHFLRLKNASELRAR